MKVHRVSASSLFLFLPQGLKMSAGGETLRVFGRVVETHNVTCQRRAADLAKFKGSLWLFSPGRNGSVSFLNLALEAQSASPEGFYRTVDQQFSACRRAKLQLEKL